MLFSLLPTQKPKCIHREGKYDYQFDEILWKLLSRLFSRASIIYLIVIACKRDVRGRSEGKQAKKSTQITLTYQGINFEEKYFTPIDNIKIRRWRIIWHPSTCAWTLLMQRWITRKTLARSKSDGCSILVRTRFPSDRNLHFKSTIEWPIVLSKHKWCNYTTNKTDNSDKNSNEYNANSNTPKLEASSSSTQNKMNQPQWKWRENRHH